MSKRLFVQISFGLDFMKIGEGINVRKKISIVSSLAPFLLFTPLLRFLFLLHIILPLCSTLSNYSCCSYSISFAPFPSLFSSSSFFFLHFTALLLPPPPFFLRCSFSSSFSLYSSLFFAPLRLYKAKYSSKYCPKHGTT